MISSTLEVPLANSLRTLFHANVTDCMSPIVSAHVEYVPKWEPDPTPFAPHVNVAVTVTALQCGEHCDLGVLQLHLNVLAPLIVVAGTAVDVSSGSWTSLPHCLAAAAFCYATSRVFLLLL